MWLYVSPLTTFIYMMMILCRWTFKPLCGHRMFYNGRINYILLKRCFLYKIWSSCLSVHHPWQSSRVLQWWLSLTLTWNFFNLVRVLIRGLAVIISIFLRPPRLLCEGPIFKGLYGMSNFWEVLFWTTKIKMCMYIRSDVLMLRVWKILSYSSMVVTNSLFNNRLCFGKCYLVHSNLFIFWRKLCILCAQL
jgi:hypothetical protein